MNRVVIITHGGCGDHINLHGLIRYYASIVPDKLVVMSQGNCHALLCAMYEDLSNVEIFLDRDMYPELMFHDMYLLQRTNSTHLIRVGFYLFECVINFKPEISFIDAFYLSKHLDPKMRYTNFKIPNSIKEESNIVYNDFIKQYGENYILIHEDPGNSIINGLKYNEGVRKKISPINKEYIINKNLPIININLISDKMIEYYDIILNAKEIHLIDSAWASYIYILNHIDTRFENVPVYMHYYSREFKNPLLYESPKYKNWNFID